MPQAEGCNKKRRIARKKQSHPAWAGQMVYDSYQKVSDKNGGAGLDKETIEKFNEYLSANLYKVWNRMALGSYFPPSVRTVKDKKEVSKIFPWVILQLVM